jgi:hypothetical protein
MARKPFTQAERERDLREARAVIDRLTVGRCEICGEPARHQRRFLLCGRVFDGLVCDTCGTCETCGVDVVVRDADGRHPHVECPVCDRKESE